MARERSISVSFSIDEHEHSGILADVLKENEVYLSGSAIGKGLNRACRFYLKERLSTAPIPEHFELRGASDLNDTAQLTPLEESFYVVDIGLIVSQVYQWRKR